MKNKTEFAWIGLVLIIVAVVSGVQMMRRAPSSEPPVSVAPASSSAQSASPTASDAAASQPSSASPSAKASFFVEQTRFGYDGSRTFFRLEIVREKAGNGARYEASLSENGQTRATTGRLDEKALNDFFEELRAHGAWRLVNSAPAGPMRDVTRLYIQEGSRSHLVTIGPDADQVSRSVERFLSESIVGTVAYSLANPAAGASPSPAPVR